MKRPITALLLVAMLALAGAPIASAVALGGPGNLLGTLGSDFANPRKITVGPDGLVYVPALAGPNPWDAGFVKVYDAGGKLVRTIGAGLLSSPQAVAVTGDRVYVVDNFAAFRIVLFDTFGSYISEVSGTWYTDIAAMPDGRVVAVASGDSRLDVYDADLTLLGTIGEPGSGDGQLTNPVSLDIDSAGTLVVGDGANSRIQFFSSEGAFIRQWPVEDPQGVDIAYGLSGIVHFLGPDEVRSYTATGVLTGSFPIPSVGGIMTASTGIAVTAGGQILVSETSANLIMAFSSAGNLVHQWVGRSNGMSLGTAIDANGDVCVAMLSTDEIRIFNGEGSFLRSWKPVVPPTITPTPVTLWPNVIAIHDGTILLGGQYGIFKFDKFGTFLGMIGAVAPQGLEPSIFGVAVDDFHRVAATTGFGPGTSNQLWTGTIDGSLSLLVDYPREAGESGNCLVNIDGNGLIYISHEGNFQIKVFNFSGTLQRVVTAADVPLPGFQPHGSAVDGLGNLYLASSSSGTPAIAVLPSYGSPTIIWLQDGFSPYLISVTRDGGKLFASGFSDPTSVHVYEGLYYTPPPAAPLVISPNGGENWLVGSFQSVIWDPVTTLGAEVDIWLLGSGEFPILQIAANAPNTGAFPWMVPVLASASDFTVRVSACGDPAVQDTSDGPFSIGYPPAGVISPNGGESWDAGTTQAITWVAAASFGSQVDIQLWRNGGIVRRLAAGVPNDGSWSWASSVSEALGDGYEVRVLSTANNNTMDASDAPFSIVGPTVAVMSPNGGESWQPGSIHPIIWTGSLVPTATVNIQLFRDGVLVRTIATGAPNTGSFSWAIPLSQTPGTNCRVKVVAALNAAIGDTSDADFTIAPPATVAFPNGGETLEIGTTRSITWSAATLGATVRIELYKGGGYNRTIAAGAANTGSFAWTLPWSLPVGSDYRVRVCSVANNNIGDSGDGMFAIVKPVLAVTSPNGGESWSTGTTKTITWTATPGVGSSVIIELWKGGAIDRTISYGAPNSGSAAWVVPVIAQRSDYWVKVFSANRMVNDGSDGMFTIAPPLVTVTSPNGGENWSPGTNKTVTWISGDGVGSSVKVELWKGGALAKALAASTPNTGMLVYAIPLGEAPGTTYRVKVTSLSNTAATDTSDGDFTIGSPVTVTSPNGGETWSIGATRTITWDTSAGFGPTVQIQIWKGTGINRSIAASAPNIGYYDYKIPASVPAGSDYRVRIASVANNNINDYSDGYFAVQAGPTAPGEPLAWVAVESPVTSQTLRGIWRSPDGRLFAVGTGGTILERTGGAWYQMPCPVPSDLLSVWGRSSTEVYAVGVNGAFLQYNGAVWIPLPPPGTGAPLRSVWGDGDGSVLVSAADGSVWRWSPGWAMMLPPSPSRFFDATALWGTGSGESYGVFTDWMLAVLQPTGGSTIIGDVAMGGGFVTGLGGTSNGMLYGTRIDGTIFRYDGALWDLLPGGAGAELYGVCAGGTTGEVVAVGENGTIVRALDPYAVGTATSCDTMGCH